MPRVNSTLTRDIPVPVNATIDQLDNIPLSTVQGFKEISLPWYADQVLPFDITCACANEYGAAASAKLYGVEILNEGFGFSVDDSVLEQQSTFVARSSRRLRPWVSPGLLYLKCGTAGVDLVCSPSGADRHNLNSLPSMQPLPHVSR